MAAALVAIGGVAAAAPHDSAQQPAPRAASCGGLKPTIKGSKGDDRGPRKLKGTASDDVISAGPGADLVKAGAGDDTLCGGPGKDTLIGGPGLDTCVGGPGKDKLKGCEPGGGPPGGAPPPPASNLPPVAPVNQPPVADDESFAGANGAVGNTALVANAPGDGPPALSAPKKSISGDILAGDTDPDGDSLVVQPVTNQPTNDGGRVTIESDGDFIFTPAVATSCSDHSDFFDYTVSDQNTVGPGPTPGTDMGQVTIATAGCVWYVNNNFPAGNSGTSDAPFDTLAQAEVASGANDTVFVFDGDNTSTGYGGDGYAMNAGERLIGEHEGLVVDPDGAGPLGSVSLQPANPGAYPTLTASNADVIDLDDGNEVRGITVDPQGTGGGIAGGAGDTGGTIDDVNVVDTGTAGTQPGIELNGTTGTFNFSGLTVSTSAATGMLLNSAGTVAVTGAANSINSVSATALSVTSTTIAAGGLTFQSISAGNNTGAADPANGIVLNNTGSTAGLTVTGTGGANSGGTIQNTSSHGITLASTRSVSLDHMNIQNTAGSGIRGTTAVNGFSFTNGTINNSGTGGGNQESNIAFNDPAGLDTDAKVTGAVTITGNTLTNALWHGVSIVQFAGMLDDVNISNNVLTSATTTGTGGSSFGSGIGLFVGGTASSVASVTRAELNNNTITNFPGGDLIALQGGTFDGTGPVGTFGTPTSASDDIEVIGNILNGGGTTPDGAGGFIKTQQLVLANVLGRGVGNFNIQNNGTVADPISGSAGNAIDISANGDVTVKAIASGNRIDAAGQSVSGTSGIAAGLGSVTVSGPATLGNSKLYGTVQNNNVANSAGSGIRLNVNDGTPALFATVTGNTVGAPSSASYGMQVNQGPTGTKTTELQIANNTTAGGTGGGNTFPGIGLRKQGTTAGEFKIVGLSPAPATNAQMESSVAGQNTSTPGTFGTNGVAAINGTSSNWTSIASVSTP